MVELRSTYNRGLRELVESHAPLLTKTIILRPSCPWYTEELCNAKHLRRKLQRLWRKTRLTVHRVSYREQCITVNRLIIKARRDYYVEKIEQCGRDQKKIFRTAKHLLGDGNSPTLPEHRDAMDLSERFNAFFINKIEKIRERLVSHR